MVSRETLASRSTIISNDPYNPYAASQPSPPPIHAPSTPWNGEPPKVIFWARVYNALMIALYVLVTVGGFAMYGFAEELAEGDPTNSPGQMRMVGAFYAGIGIVLAVLFLVAFIWRKGNGAWIYQIVLIVLGLTSCCTWPATIPLMIYWIKDREQIIQS